QRPKRVALFVTCMVDMLYPGVGIAACELLEKNDVEVIFPEEQTCCGQPAFNAGYRDEARKLARRFLAIFAPLVESGEVDAIVAPSGSCATMTSHFFEPIFQESQETDLAHQAERLASVTFELTEFLVDVLGIVDTGAQLQGKATYHPCCHLYRELGVDRQPRTLLDGVEGLEVVDLPHADDCCGFGGLFAIKNSGISAAMGRAKATNAEQSGADAIVLCDVSCMTHINGILSREGIACRAHHIAEILNNHLGSTLRPPSQPAPAQADHPRRWGD
ncbi:MAG: (Fe-S)-binding protein, partial [Caldilineaceae bacterium]|nr:(Fe-S)-binding protein [Caldilineaceae bacterium]